MAEKPGWYPDPADRTGVYRWWSGQGWTRWMSESADAPPPEGHDDPRVTAVVVPRADRQVSHAARTIVVAIVVVLAVVVIAAIGGAVANRTTVHPDQGQTPTDLTATPEMVGATFTLDEETHTVTFGDLSGAMPTVGEQGDFAPYNFFGAGATTQIVVPQPSGAQDWAATVMFGEYRGPVQLDLRGYAEQVLSELPFEIVEDEVTGIEDVEVGDLGELPEERALSLTAKLTYPPGAVGDSSADYAEIVVIKVNEAQYAVWISLVPENADQDVRDAVQGSRDSLRVKDR